MISQVECGGKRPSIATMRKLSIALSVPLGRIVTAVHGPNAKLQTISVTAA